MSYNFTTSWFDLSELKEYLHRFIEFNDIHNFLEIGSFEGASACFISDNYLNEKGSTLVCVDPFDTSDSTSPVYSNMKSVFINNISKSKNWNKIRLRQLYSDDFFKKNKNTYSFIYIDGSHLLEDIESDFNNSLKIIRNNGIIWMDDYASSKQVTELIDRLYEENKQKLNIIHKGYQIAFRKID
jgi:predicted O-methyltransferase YrrM